MRHNNGIPFRSKVDLLKARSGQIWNKNIALRQKMLHMPGQARASDAACPLCGDHDGITHMLANVAYHICILPYIAYHISVVNCAYPMIEAMYIERHNAATREILRLILEGSRGNCYMLADTGSTNKLRNTGP